MRHIEESIWINRPRQEVWDYVDDPANQTIWQTSVLEFHQDGLAEVGKRSTGVAKIAGKRFSWTSEITQADIGKKLAWKDVEGPVDTSGGIEFADEKDGTRMTYYFEADSFGGFFGKIADPIILKMTARDMRASLENLKTILEET